jgi:hypothetical protein
MYRYLYRTFESSAWHFEVEFEVGTGPKSQNVFTFHLDMLEHQGRLDILTNQI